MEPRSPVDLSERLWWIYTYYTVNFKPLEAPFLSAHAWVTFTEEARLSRGHNTSLNSSMSTGRKKGGGELMQAEVLVLMKSVVTKRALAVGEENKCRKMTFSDFLEALTEISTRLVTTGTADEALQWVLENRVFPYSRTRHPFAIDVPLSEIEHLWARFNGPLRLLMEHYGDFHDAKEWVVSPGERVASINRSQLSARVNTMACAMSFRSWCLFCEDFNLCGSMLSSRQTAEAFLDADKCGYRDDRMGKLYCEEMWEALLRCALAAFHHHVSVERKFKAILQHLVVGATKSAAISVNRQRQPSSVGYTSQGILEGTKRLQAQFRIQWEADGFMDYLHDEVPFRPTGRQLVSEISLRMTVSPNASTLLGGTSDESNFAGRILDRSYSASAEKAKKRSTFPLSPL